MFNPSERHWAENFLRGRDGVKVVPYTRVQVSPAEWLWSLNEKHVYEWFARMQRDRTVEKVFYDGTVRDPLRFLEFLQNPRNLVIALADDDDEWLGVSWINNIGANNAGCHFAFFSEAWGDHTKTMGVLTMGYWFAMPGSVREHQFDVLLGCTPANNRLAVRYLRALKMSVLGEVPHLCGGVPGIISYMSREDFRRSHG